MDAMIGKRIRQKRKELHLTQVQIRELCGISNGNLSDLENGNRLPSAGALVALSRALGVSTDWILTGEDHHDNIASRIYLNPEEDALIRSFRQLDHDDQDEVLEIVQIKLRKKTRGGAGSSNSGDADSLKNGDGAGVVSA